ncbi:hypothetical protein [Aquibacillus saliphilus]|uniref:hypothetical protein n=1 Tax=Aquibacillus saliphilus TaxID=1909422 RepID=UPI001CF08CB0|nr:hypothetical protein [Aquibacillus saliphilus]
MKESKVHRAVKIATNITLVLLFLGAFQMLLDNIYENDHYGWLFLIAFCTLISLYGFFEDRKNDKNKSAIISLLPAVVGFGVLLWQTIVFLTF